MTKRSELLNYPEIPFTISPSELYKKYLESRIWRCKESPSKAHYWVINNGRMICKYCNESRRVVTRAYDPSKTNSQLFTKGTHRINRRQAGVL